MASHEDCWNRCLVQNLDSLSRQSLLPCRHPLQKRPLQRQGVIFQLGFSWVPLGERLMQFTGPFIPVSSASS